MTRSTSRGRIDLVAMVLLPLVGTLGLALLLFGQVKSAENPTGQASAPIPDQVPPSGGASLPRSNVTELLSAVTSQTDARFDCTGPYRGGGTGMTWACRSRDAVIVLNGTADLRIVTIDATAFGFGDVRRVLSPWAQAAQLSPTLAAEAAAWVGGASQRGEAKNVGTVTMRLAGARGAVLLSIIAG